MNLSRESSEPYLRTPFRPGRAWPSRIWDHGSAAGSFVRNCEIRRRAGHIGTISVDLEVVWKMSAETYDGADPGHVKIASDG